MEDDPLIGLLLLQLFFILLNAVFACAEIAVLSVNEVKLNKLAAEGDKRAARLSRLTSQPARFLATIQISITLAGFLGSAFAADNFADRLVEAVQSTGVNINAHLLNSISVVVITLILSFFTLVFGELVPKRLAMKKAESIALALSGVISFISAAFRPIVWLLTVSTNLVLKLLGVDPNEEDDELTEDEIRMMIDAGSEKGAIEEGEKELLQNVFEFNDIAAEDILTHRTMVDMLWTEETDAEWETTIKETNHSHYPVCGDTADDVVGVLKARDYLKLTDRTRESVMKNAVSPALFVPLSVKADDLFREMRRTRNHFAVVLDEYGGMSGIVTMHDLLELLVGDLTEKDDKEEYEISRLSETEWEITGLAPIDKVEASLGVKLPEEESEHFETFGGYVCGMMGTLPEDGASFELSTEQMNVRVLSVEDRCIKRVIVTLPERKAEEKASE